MDRRTAIRNLAIVIGGAALLPACTKHNPIAHFKHFDIDLDQQTLITDIAETIIPKTNTPGATDLNLYGFIMKMLDDCSKKEDQQAFLKGMGEFNTVPQKLFKKDFAAHSAGRFGHRAGFHPAAKPVTHHEVIPFAQFPHKLAEL